MSTGAVTALLDRVEKAGYIRRAALRPVHRLGGVFRPTIIR